MKGISIKLINEFLFKKYNDDMCIDWIDDQGIMKLNRKNFIVKFTLKVTSTSNIYDSYKVEIISLDRGLIDSKLFEFINYFYNENEIRNYFYNENEIRNHCVYVYKQQDGYQLYPIDFHKVNFDKLIQRIFDYINYFDDIVS